MPGSSGNGKTDTLRERFAHNQAAREQALEKLEGIEWDEEVTETNITVEKGATVVVTTGKHAAMSKDQADEITLTDHGAPPRKADSDPPPSKVSPLGIAWVMAKKFPPWGAVAVAIAAIVAYVLTR